MITPDPIGITREYEPFSFTGTVVDPTPEITSVVPRQSGDWTISFSGDTFTISGIAKDVFPNKTVTWNRYEFPDGYSIVTHTTTSNNFADVPYSGDTPETRIDITNFTPDPNITIFVEFEIHYDRFEDDEVTMLPVLVESKMLIARLQINQNHTPGRDALLEKMGKS